MIGAFEEGLKTNTLTQLTQRVGDVKISLSDIGEPSIRAGRLQAYIQFPGLVEDLVSLDKEKGAFVPPGANELVNLLKNVTRAMTLTKSPYSLLEDIDTAIRGRDRLARSK